MVPVHAAFELGYTSWQLEFAAYFRRFDSAETGAPTDDKLNRLQYDYLVSEFVVEAAEHSRIDLIPPGLIPRLAAQIHAWWAIVPATEWAHTPFAGGIHARLQWKLQTTTVARSYYRAIIDEEYFLFAITADLRRYERATHASVAAAPGELNEILDVAHDVFAQRSAWLPNGGWLIDLGAWTDHPDFAYAGRDSASPDLTPLPVPGVAPDASHFSRMPMWLSSLEGAGETIAEREFYRQMKRGLATQFLKRILVSPSSEFPAYRTTNYADGRNGIYRWNYPTQGQGNGYLPFQVGGEAFTCGWWAFLSDARVSQAYRIEASLFPLPANVLATYVGPNTTRDRNPIFRLPNTFTNGLSHLLVILAGRL